MEVGEGEIDWESVGEAAVNAGVEWYIVEQDCRARPAWESIRMSLDYLRRRGFVA